MRFPTEPSEWTEKDWIEHLHRRASRLTPDANTAADLAMECLRAFRNRFQHYPWQHPAPHHAWNWCQDKLWALIIDEAWRAGRVVQTSWEALSEGVASVEMEEPIQSEIDAQAFLDSLPEGLREMLQLRLEGYSWEETARLLGRNPNTLRSYLPDVRKRFVEFFGYDPSKRASESFNRVAGENAPEVGGIGDEGTERSEEEFTDDTGSAGGGNHPATKWRCDMRAARALLMGRRGRWLAIVSTLLTHRATKASACRGYSNLLVVYMALAQANVYRFIVWLALLSTFYTPALSQSSLSELNAAINLWNSHYNYVAECIGIIEHGEISTDYDRQQILSEITNPANVWMLSGELTQPNSLRLKRASDFPELVRSEEYSNYVSRIRALVEQATLWFRVEWEIPVVRGGLWIPGIPIGIGSTLSLGGSCLSCCECRLIPVITRFY